MIKKSYSELILLPTIRERFEYLRLDGHVGMATFGFDRYLNQALYRSKEWRRLRRDIIVRDNGCDLGLEGYPCGHRAIVHHINPIREEQVIDRDPMVLDPENLILCSYQTHNMIHYGNVEGIAQEVPERYPNDTILWR